MVQALGTPWGLLKHYWVLVKLVLTLGATLVLLHMQPISYLAEVAAKTNLSATELRGLRIQLIADAAAALVVLLTSTAISVYKPWGRIGKRRQQRDRRTLRPWAPTRLFPRPRAAICPLRGWLGCCSLSLANTC